jgi:quercetin dioxygenase-like cupin family protein
MSAPKKKNSKRKPVKRENARKKQSALKHTVSARTRHAATLKYLSWDDVELETMHPLLDRQLVVGQNVMLARVLLKKGCIVPLHSHVNEQLSYILAGALKFYIDEREIIVRAGEVLTIPPNMPHKAEALEDTVDLDIFHPPRADWINKTDNYLRK